MLERHTMVFRISDRVRVHCNRSRHSRRDRGIRDHSQGKDILRLLVLLQLPYGHGSTFTVAVILSMAVSITETLLLPKFVIYANGVAPAILINIEIIVADIKAIEHIFCLWIM
jgi:hypothetical protein